MNRSSPLRAAVAASSLFALAACSSQSEPQDSGAVTQFELPDSGIEAAMAAEGEALPGKIDPPEATWRAVTDGALYGEPGKVPLIELKCRGGTVAVTRNAKSDDGAKALLAFVGYRGILRLKVESDGGAWHGSLASDDPHWIAVTGGPFYATVAGGGKVISPASSIAANIITGCKAPQAETKPDAET